MKKVKDVRWFTSQGSTIGIVLLHDKTYNEWKAYIGKGTGLDESLDTDTIVKWGAKFPVDAARQMFHL